VTIWLQNFVHKIELGAGAGYMRIMAGVLVGLFLVVGYNLRSYRNFSTQEAMDQAQLARNIAEGRGYTTKFIRPFSMFLMQRANRERLDSLTAEQRGDLCVVKAGHPDLANPPVYPLVLAGLMKAGLIPKEADAATRHKFWSSGNVFMRFPPDFFISLWNQLALLGVVVQVFFIARRLFDTTVAVLAALLLMGTELMWRFSVSGLSTMLLIAMFLGLVQLALRFEAAAAAPEAKQRTVLGLALGIGLLLGVGMLTRYGYGALALPVLAFVAAFGGRWRIPAVLTALAAFVLVVAPWIARNVALCGAPFGVSSYAIYEGTAYFQGDSLQRALEPGLNNLRLTAIWWKVFGNLRNTVSSDLLTMTGGLIFAFFVTGMIIPFRNQSISRMRHLIVGTLLTLLVAQAAGRTYLSDESPVVNTENLLVLLMPLVIIFGTALFRILLDQWVFPIPALRVAAIVLFGITVSLSMILTFLPPRTNPVSFPPYHPPSIQAVSGWMNESELTMSDIPWAVAWYGNRQSVMLTSDAREHFYAINDFIKPVSALYLSPRALDAKFLTQWSRSGAEATWGEIVIMSLSKEELPPRFPLRKSFRLQDQLFLTNWERWPKKEPDAE